MASPFRPLHVETPEELLRRENAELRAEVREWRERANLLLQRAWRVSRRADRAEQRLDLWMPLGAVALAALTVLALSWLTAVLS